MFEGATLAKIRLFQGVNLHLSWDRSLAFHFDLACMKLVIILFAGKETLIKSIREPWFPLSLSMSGLSISKFLKHSQPKKGKIVLHGILRIELPQLSIEFGHCTGIILFSGEQAQLTGNIT